MTMYNVHFELDCSLWIEASTIEEAQNEVQRMLNDMAYHGEPFHNSLEINQYEAQIDHYNDYKYEKE